MITDSTLSGNEALQSGGAIGVTQSSSLTVVNSTIASNEAVNTGAGFIA